MELIHGIPASPGIGIGPAFVLLSETPAVARKQVSDLKAEIARFEAAREAARSQVESIQSKAEKVLSIEEARIFEAHLLMLDDPTLLEEIHASIEREKNNAEVAVQDAIEAHAKRLERMEDETFRARAADLRDIGRRLIRNLSIPDAVDFSALEQIAIVVAQDLSPSDTIQLDKSLVLGFCTAEGGPTSHAAILAKALEIPAVVSVGQDLFRIKSGQFVIMDGTTGEIILDPTEEVQQQYQTKIEALTQQAKLDLESASKPAITQDGHQIEIGANVSHPNEAQSALRYGAEGIGLLRTEFHYLNRSDPPGEEEQLQTYQAVLQIMQDHPVVIRTLDVGGDKDLPYLQLAQEPNPFLGWRAIRLCLDREDLFVPQLRAILRAGHGYDLRIMFPMVASLDEVLRAKQLLSNTKQGFLENGLDIATDLRVGIMIEVPAAVVIADQLAKHVDFFSIGTNDLAQYTMAADRTNEKVAHLNDAMAPAVLRQIASVAQSAHDQRIPVSVCGELAGDPEAIPILIGLGIDKLSMVPQSIPSAKALIRRWSLKDAQDLAQQALNLENAAAVREKSRSYDLLVGD